LFRSSRSRRSGPARKRPSSADPDPDRARSAARSMSCVRLPRIAACRAMARDAVCRAMARDAARWRAMPREAACRAMPRVARWRAMPRVARRDSCRGPGRHARIFDLPRRTFASGTAPAGPRAAKPTIRTPCPVRSVFRCFCGESLCSALDARSGPGGIEATGRSGSIARGVGPCVEDQLRA